jgi:hypothetical protein
MRPKKVLTDEQTGQLSDRIDEFKARVLTGTLPYDLAMQFLQRGIEGHLGVTRVEFLRTDEIKTCDGAILTLEMCVNAALARGLDLMTQREVQDGLDSWYQKNFTACVVTQDLMSLTHYFVFYGGRGRIRKNESRSLLKFSPLPHDLLAFVRRA